MTLKEFFRKARRSRTWGFKMGLNEKWDYVPQVRCASGYCPLAAVTHGLWNPLEAAKALGISGRLASKIARAADFPKSKHRKWLLKNLGIRA